MELKRALGTREAEVKVVQDDGARVFIEANSRSSLQGAALFARADRQIQVMHVRERPAAEDGVAIASHREAMLGAVDAMRHAERFAQELRLVVELRARHVFGHFLQQRDVRELFAQHVHDPARCGRADRRRQCPCGCSR